MPEPYCRRREPDEPLPLGELARMLEGTEIVHVVEVNPLDAGVHFPEIDVPGRIEVRPTPSVPEGGCRYHLHLDLQVD